MGGGQQVDAPMVELCWAPSLTSDPIKLPTAQSWRLLSREQMRGVTLPSRTKTLSGSLALAPRYNLVSGYPIKPLPPCDVCHILAGVADIISPNQGGFFILFNIFTCTILVHFETFSTTVKLVILFSNSLAYMTIEILEMLFLGEAS